MWMQKFQIKEKHFRNKYIKMSSVFLSHKPFFSFLLSFFLFFFLPFFLSSFFPFFFSAFRSFLSKREELFLKEKKRFKTADNQFISTPEQMSPPVHRIPNVKFIKPSMKYSIFERPSLYEKVFKGHNLIKTTTKKETHIYTVRVCLNENKKTISRCELVKMVGYDIRKVPDKVCIRLIVFLY